MELGRSEPYADSLNCMSDSASDLLSTLQAAGFTLTVRAGKLIVAPASLLTPELTEAIRQHKAGLLALLATDRPLSPLEKFVAGHTPAASVEIFIELPGGQYRAVSAEHYARTMGEAS